MNKLHPLVPFLTGLLYASINIQGRHVAKVVNIEVGEPDAFNVHFARGLVLRVSVAEANSGQSEKKGKVAG